MEWSTDLMHVICVLQVLCSKYLMVEGMTKLLSFVELENKFA